VATPAPLVSASRCADKLKMPRLLLPISLIALLCALGLSAQESGAPTSLVPVWTLGRDGEIAASAVSSSGRCVAIALNDAVIVVSAAGPELWRWQFARSNPFVRAAAVAIAPSCRFIAVVGDAGCRYSWIVHQNGRRVPLATKATPLSVAISHDGALVAVGTGADDVWVYTPDGTPRWRTHLDAGCCVRGLAFAENDREVFVTSWGTSVLSVTGEVKWSQWDGTCGLRPTVEPSSRIGSRHTGLAGRTLL
jgi:hypothetical protein